MKRHALAELDGVDETVPADHRQALGQERHRPVGVVERVEALEDVVGRNLGQVGGRPVGVERRGLAVETYPEDAAALLGVGAAARGEHGSQREQDGSGPERVHRHGDHPSQAIRGGDGNASPARALGEVIGVSRARGDGAAHGWSASNAAAARRTRASACHRPTI